MDLFHTRAFVINKSKTELLIHKVKKLSLYKRKHYTDRGSKKDVQHWHITNDKNFFWGSKVSEWNQTSFKSASETF